MNNKVEQLINLSKDLNSLLDKGETLEIKDLYSVLQKKELFDWLMQRFGKQIKMKKLDKNNLKELEKQFLVYSTSVQPEELGVESNALNLLIAYCLMMIESTLKLGN